MKIGITGIYLNFGYKKNGIGRYSESLLEEFQNDSDNRYYIFVDRLYKFREFKKKFSSNLVPVLIPVPTFHILLLRLWTFILLPIYLKLFKIDLFFAPNALSPLVSNIKNVSTIHDLAFLNFPQNVLPKFLELYKKKYKKVAEKSDIIITVSNYSKNDIIKNYKIPDHKIKVIYNGIDPNFRNTELVFSKKLLLQYGISKPYLFYYGTIEPRKNLANLILAFEKLKEDNDLQLVICGKTGWLSEALFKQKSESKFSSDILFTGYLEDKNVVNLLRYSCVFTYIPQFEGFGLPIVEAMAMGKWIVTSNTSSIPEIIDNKTISVDPFNIDQIVNAISEQYSNSQKQEFNTDAILKSHEFSWSNSAQKHIQLFKELKNG